MSKVQRFVLATALAAAPLAGSLAMAAPASAGEYVCYGDETIVHNNNTITGDTTVSAPVVTGVSGSSTGCPDQSVGV